MFEKASNQLMFLGHALVNPIKTEIECNTKYEKHVYFPQIRTNHTRC